MTMATAMAVMAMTAVIVMMVMVVMLVNGDDGVNVKGPVMW